MINPRALGFLCFISKSDNHMYQSAQDIDLIIRTSAILIIIFRTINIYQTCFVSILGWSILNFDFVNFFLTPEKSLRNFPHSTVILREFFKNIPLKSSNIARIFRRLLERFLKYYRNLTMSTQNIINVMLLQYWYFILIFL